MCNQHTTQATDKEFEGLKHQFEMDQVWESVNILSHLLSTVF